jgi:hypothetical protein
MARGVLAEVHLFAGRNDAALEAIEEAVGIAVEAGARFGRFGALESQRARALLARGEIAAAREVMDRVVAAPESRPRLRAAHLVVHAQVLTHADAIGERARIEAILGEAADLAQRIGTPGLQAAVCTERAHLARALGDAAGCERELREALRIYTEMDATGWMERIEQELAS